MSLTFRGHVTSAIRVKQGMGGEKLLRFMRHCLENGKKYVQFIVTIMTNRKLHMTRIVGDSVETPTDCLALCSLRSFAVDFIACALHALLSRA